MQREIILDMAEQCAARSLSTLHPVERALQRDEPPQRSDYAELRLQLALIQQVEALRLTLLATMAPIVHD